MKIITRFLTILIIVSFSVFSVSCDEEAADKKTDEGDYTNVEVRTISSESFTDYVSVIGTIKPINFASISHETGGIIDVILKDKGEYVSKGDTILILDNDALKASMESAKAQYELAQARFERQKKVYDEKVGSEFEFLNTKYTRDQLKAVYDQAKVLYEKSFIKAPFNGIVDSRYYELGELVPPSMPVVKVLDASNLEIRAGVPERYAGNIKKGADVRVYIKELFDEPITSEIKYVGKALDPANRTFPVEVIIPNKENLIKPEMLADLKIARAGYENVLVIPEEVVTKSDDGYIAFVAENNLARLRNIEILARVDDKVVVENGLRSGDKLITLGFQNLVDGENIKIVN